MKRKNEMVPGFDDIVFENRNKEYGAYQLRKRYSRTSFWSMAGGVLIFTATVIVLSALTVREVTGEKDDDIIVIATMDSTITQVNRLRQDVPELPKQEIKVNAYLPPEIVEKLDSGDVTLASVSTLDTISNDPVDIDIIPEDDPGLIPGKEEDPPYIIEEMPSFPGGEQELLKFIYNNIKYPAEASDNNIEGRVVLKFVVGADGSISRIEVLRSAHPVLDQEALRVASLIPKWNPGYQNGEPAPVWYVLPVSFKLTGK